MYIPPVDNPQPAIPTAARVEREREDQRQPAEQAASVVRVSAVARRLGGQQRDPTLDPNRPRRERGAQYAEAGRNRPANQGAEAARPKDVGQRVAPIVGRATEADVAAVELALRAAEGAPIGVRSGRTPIEPTPRPPRAAPRPAEARREERAERRSEPPAAGAPTQDEEADAAAMRIAAARRALDLTPAPGEARQEERRAEVGRPVERVGRDDRGRGEPGPDVARVSEPAGVGAATPVAPPVRTGRVERGGVDLGDFDRRRETERRDDVGVRVVGSDFGPASLDELTAGITTRFRGGGVAGGHIHLSPNCPVCQAGIRAYKAASV